jgi:hypothetical protein
LEALLRQHGASDDLPRMDSIMLRRSVDRAVKVFSRADEDSNRYTLLELIGVHYGFISAEVSVNPGAHANYSGTTHVVQGALAFPNLDKIEIRRAKPGGKEWASVPAPIKAILDSGDCSHDVWLEWGDQVEIPELDHPIGQSWGGFSQSIITNLQKCLARNIQMTVKGQSTTLPLTVPLPQGQVPLSDFLYQPPDFFVTPVLQRSGLLRTSSDLSRVKVTRHNSATGENWERTFDCSGATPYPALWLRDGDQIEVPDKP